MTKTKAIEILNQRYDEYVFIQRLRFSDESDVINRMIALLTAIDALQQSSNIEAEHDNGWISVKDRLPDKDGKYMVWYKGESCICEFDAESQTFGYTYDDYDEMYSHLVCWDDDMHKDVTHWRPLPEPPESAEIMEAIAGSETPDRAERRPR